MSPSKREREYARRRYNDWQARRDARAARSRRMRMIAAIVAAALAVATVVALVVIAALPEQDAETTAADQSPTTATESDAASNPCPPVPDTEPNTPSDLALPDPATAQGKEWTATIATTCGELTFSLDGAAAPQAVANFTYLAEAGFFDNTPCHRLTTSGIYVLQCGDPEGTGMGGPGYTWGPVENAPADGIYPAGTVAMARRADDANSQGSQFFIVYKDSPIPSDSAGGYTVFGSVTSGMDVVQLVSEGGTGSNGIEPARPISIESVEVS
ncbi:MAG: peptidylprolyl isomerase [Actinomycetales bacterium]